MRKLVTFNRNFEYYKRKNDSHKIPRKPPRDFVFDEPF